jgi:hypothetical protein
MRQLTHADGFRSKCRPARTLRNRMRCRIAPAHRSSAAASGVILPAVDNTDWTSFKASRGTAEDRRIIKCRNVVSRYAVNPFTTEEFSKPISVGLASNGSPFQQSTAPNSKRNPTVIHAMIFTVHFESFPCTVGSTAVIVPIDNWNSSAVAMASSTQGICCTRGMSD